MILRFALAVALAGMAASPAFATGKMSCDVKPEARQPQAALVAALTKQGWTVRKAKLDGGCYEVYGTTPEGARVEAYFHPVTLEKLYVARRGEVLFRKSGY